MNSDTILQVEGVWKKYCRQLKRAMWYGMCDITGQLRLGGREPAATPQLRKGEFFAVRNASFEVRKGECVGMIGPNGAGKSTMLKMINGLIRPDAGRITIRGKIGALIELGTGFNPVLSGRENIYVNAAVLGMGKREVDRVFDEIVDFADLHSVIGDPIKTYSSGMKVRLGFSVAAHLRPSLLIMDEVLAVGDIAFRMKCFNHFNTLTKNGTSIILVTHAVGMLPRVATRSVVFDTGRICFDGDVQQGMTVYEENLSVRATQNRPVTQSASVEGSDVKARISLVEVRDATDNVSDSFQTGDRMRLVVDVQCVQPLDSARLIVAICSPRHDELGSTSSVANDIRPNLGVGTHRFVLEIDRLPVLMGSYYFNISLYGAELTDYQERRLGVGVFKITGPPVDVNGNGLYGTLAFDHSWNFSENIPAPLANGNTDS